MVHYCVYSPHFMLLIIITSGYMHVYCYIWICSDYGYARASTDSTGSCISDEDVSLPDPCADGKIDTYNASTG